MENGKILYPSLKKTRVSINELIENLRENGVLDPSTVRYAILETDGNISVLPYEKYQPAAAIEAGIKVQETPLPIAVVSDGKWQEENLRLSNKSKTWVLEELKKQNCRLKDVLILTVAADKVFYLARRDI